MSIKKNQTWPLWVGILATIVILCLNYYLLFQLPNEERGTFGDMFGLSTSLFTGLAFVGLIYTILLQRQDLSLQMEELKATREELSGQKEQMQAQVASLNLQNFENTFFQLVRLYNDNVASTKIKNASKEVTFQGKECFSRYYVHLEAAHDSAVINNNLASQSDLIEKSLDALYDKREAELAHHFRTLYSILKFVDQSKVQDKKSYTNFLRSQLSSNELLVLFYNCIGSRGAEKFKPLIERYALLKHVPKDNLIDKTHVGLYDPQAFT